ncbi:MAG: YHYH domain-containing protein [Ruminiclostridium sp.]|nr:YHYH domain-containing protein [Ruminiclostridium sp.]
MKLKYLVLLLVCFLLPVTASAHPGGTDANGGHTDRETGDYHYHHGYEAHYHTGGVCPFAFDDQTGSNSGEPSQSSDSVPKEAPDVEWVEIANGWWHNPDLDQWRDPEGNIYTELEYYEAFGYTYHEDLGIWTGPDGIINEDGIFQSYDEIADEIEAGEPEHVGHTMGDMILSHLDAIIVIILLLIFLVFPAVCVLWDMVLHFKAKKAEKRVFAEKQAHYQSLYGGKTKQEVARMCGMPDMVTIGEDGLPKVPSLWDWGEEFTFFVSKSGKAFHRSASCNTYATIPCHALHLGIRTPCTRCKPVRPDLSWYDAYRTALYNIKTYQVILSDED